MWTHMYKENIVIVDILIALISHWLEHIWSLSSKNKKQKKKHKSWDNFTAQLTFFPPQKWS